MSTIIEKAVNILTPLNTTTQHKACRYVPQTGNVYVYIWAENDTTDEVFIDFYDIIDKLTGSNKHFWCELAGTADDIAKFYFECNGSMKFIIIPSPINHFPIEVVFAILKAYENLYLGSPLYARRAC